MAKLAEALPSAWSVSPFLPLVPMASHTQRQEITSHRVELGE